MREYLPYEQDNEFLVLLCTTIVSTAIVLMFAEFIPKALFRINPDVVLFMLTFPFMIFYYRIFARLRHPRTSLRDVAPCGNGPLQFPLEAFYRRPWGPYM